VDGVRTAELLTALSLATDLGQGQPMDWELRGCLVAMGLAGAIGMNEVDRRVLFDLALLRYIGCTSHAHEVSVAFGDEIGARRHFLGFDFADRRATGRAVVTMAGAGRSLPGRLATVVATLAAGTNPVREGFRASCEVADTFASRLGYPDPVRGALQFGFERWDGLGFPNGTSGEAIPLAMRVLHVAQDAEVFARVSLEHAVAMVIDRAGTMYDPAVARAFAAVAGDVFATLDGVDPWDAVLAAEPEPWRVIDPTRVDDALAVLADYADLKSPPRAGHSRAVAAVAAAAAREARLAEADVVAANRAALVHDLGVSGIANSIWDKPGPLTSAEWERVRLHPYLTERILSRSAALAALAPVAGAHHERRDGSGYHKGVALAGPAMAPAAKIVAAADCYVAMTEPRAHRSARAAGDAARELTSMVDHGLFEPDVAAAVLAAAGHRPTVRAAWPAGLTDREVEVLRLIVRGRTAKDVARELGISVKTVGSHVEHIYAKAGVSTRGAAALFAMQHSLV